MDMDMSTLLFVVHTLLASFDALNYSELKEVWSKWKDVSNFDKLEKVAVTIKNELMDAEAKYTFDQLSLPTQEYIEELSFAIYDADDLLDEFVTLAQLKHHLLLQEDEFVKEVCLFFSHNYNDLLDVAGRMSQGIDNIKTELGLLQATSVKFGLKGLPSVETCSYPDTEIIGRGDNVKEIVGMLLPCDVSSSITIVGRGGIGKTALVQLVFNHKRIKTEFSLRLWTCVSDHDRSNLDVKAILSQILESEDKKSDSSLEVVAKRVRELLLGKRFLIVLDDLWTESRDKLQKLLRHLDGGQVGSRIVVTTRSKVTAKIMGESVYYELEGLSDVYSWDLFQRTAFDKIDHERADDSYVEKFKIGKDIIKKCAHIPLAIRVIGCLLHGQGISEWRQLQKFGLANSSEGELGIMPILKHSYNYLDYWLKSCFSYCPLYPKDCHIKKHTLIRLWIAQGYVMPCGNGKTVEEVGEEYFLVLQRRCFFQDVEKNESGEIYSFKLHDLMHDLALEVSKKEICPTSSFSRNMDKAVRHVSLTKEQCANFNLINAHIRTILITNNYRCIDGDMVPRLEKYQRLRTLDLSSLKIKILPASIGKLIHLRHLDLSENYMEVLPNSISKLYNLQTLDLNFCYKLKELPKNFSNLVNLRVLRLQRCDTSILMPFIITGMSKLITLELSTFKVGAMQSSLKQQLELFKALKMLRGNIDITIHLPSSDVLATQDNTITEGGYIRDMEHLDSIDLRFNHHESNEVGGHYEEELLGALQPHENLKNLWVHCYQGVRMPRSWAIEHNLTSVLPNLVKFHLCYCDKLKCLPFLGNLQNLKELKLRCLPKLEYMETPLERFKFFPCLQRLVLYKLPKFKGWGELGEIGDISQSHESPLFFSKLINLDIYQCRNLTSLPGCANVKTLTLCHFNERLQITSNPMSSLKLNDVTIQGDHSMSWLDSSMPIKSLQSLTKLKITWDWEVENLDDFRRVFQECSSSLRELAISGYRKLRSISGGLRYLTSLERLCLDALTVENLVDDGRAFRACSSSLRTLKIKHCNKLRSVSGSLVYLTSLESLFLYGLPILNLTNEGEEIEGDVECDGMPWGALSHTLQYLEIESCKELKTFPKWMRKLASLQELDVYNCSKELYERCQNPNGEDWPNIQHIPRIRINHPI